MTITSLLFFPFFHFPIFLLVSLFLYFLPAFLARNKQNFTGVLLLNIFAGWTLIGWIIAPSPRLLARRQPLAEPFSAVFAANRLSGMPGSAAPAAPRCQPHNAEAALPTRTKVRSVD